MTKKCEGSQKRLFECKLFEKCKGAAEQQLVECNLFNLYFIFILFIFFCLKSAMEPQSSSWLVAIYLITSRPLPVKAPTTNWGKVEGFSKCSRHILSDSTAILNLHFHVWLPLLTPSPPKITTLLFACMQKEICLCIQLFKISSYHGACWGCLVVPILQFF